MSVAASRQTIALALGDALGFAVAAVAAWAAKRLEDPLLVSEPYVLALVLLVPVQVLVLAGRGLYPGLGLGAAEELRRLSGGTTLVMLLAVALTFATKEGEAWSRQVLMTTWALALVALPLIRAAVRRGFARLGWWGIPCLVLGAGATGAEVVRLLQTRPWLGLRPVAVLDDDPARIGSQVHALTVDGPVVEASRRLAADRAIDHAILAMPGLPPERMSALIDALAGHLRHLTIAPALPGCPELIAQTREYANTLALEVRHNLLMPSARLIKRTLDLVVAGLLLIGLSWLFALLVLLVRATSRGPAFYGQPRIGRERRPLRAWKFRSMVADADAVLARHLAAHPELRAEWERDHKLRDDPRVTTLGRFLRRSSLDELPQLWNVLIGEMSLVGPRPIVEAEVAKYGDRFALYAKVRPGLSGLWQVSGRNDTTYAERVALDCYYVRNWSVWLDLVIIARTVRVVVAGRGAY